MMTTKLPDHVAGVFKYLTDPSERADEDLVLGWFRHAFGNSFTRQADANRADGYVPGHLVLELKGNSRDWLSGLFQALAQQDLDFSLAVVVARNFIGVWHVDDVNELRIEALSQSGAPHHVGKTLATLHRRQRGEILTMASWSCSKQ